MSTINESQIFGWVGTHLAQNGSITLQDIVKGTGVSVGSLYHHYRSREELLARTWIDAVSTFQSQFLAELESGGTDAGERAAMTVPKFCREEVERAKVLVCCRREQLISNTLPESLSEQIRTINKIAAKVLMKFSETHGYSLESCKLGLIAYPLGAVRLYLPDQKIPKSLDEYVRAAYLSAVKI